MLDRFILDLSRVGKPCQATRSHETSFSSAFVNAALNCGIIPDPKCSVQHPLEDHGQIAQIVETSFPPVALVWKKAFPCRVLKHPNPVFVTRGSLTLVTPPSPPVSQLMPPAPSMLKRTPFYRELQLARQHLRRVIPKHRDYRSQLTPNSLVLVKLALSKVATVVKTSPLPMPSMQLSFAARRHLVTQMMSSRDPGGVEVGCPIESLSESVRRPWIPRLSRVQRIKRWYHRKRLSVSKWWRGVAGEHFVMLDKPCEVVVPVGEDDRLLVNRVAKKRAEAEIRTCTLMSTVTLMPVRVYYDLNWLSQLLSSHDACCPNPTREALVGSIKGMGSVNIPACLSDRIRNGTILMYHYERGMTQLCMDFLLSPSHPSLA